MGVNFNYNDVRLGGRLTADVELKQTPSGVSVCAFSLAVNRKYAGADGKREVDFIDCVAWRKTAEFIAKHFRKGSPIFVVGEIQTRSWNDAQGNKRYATEVIVNEAYFIESKADNEASGADSYNPYSDDKQQFEEIPTDEHLPF